MTHRDLNSAAQKLGNFMTSNEACIQAAKSLGNGVEIGILIEGELECAFYKSVNSAGFETRKAKDPDVIFQLNLTAIDVLCTLVEKNLGELGIEVLKQYLNGNVQIRVTGGFLGVMKNGYLSIVKDAGLPFAKFMAEHGVSNLSKIPELIKKLKIKTF